MSCMSDSDRFLEAAIIASSEGLEWSGCCGLDGMVHVEKPEDAGPEGRLVESGPGRAMNGSLVDSDAVEISADRTCGHLGARRLERRFDTCACGVAVLDDEVL